MSSKTLQPHNGGTKILRDLILERGFKNTNSEISIQRMVGCKIKNQWQKRGTYMIKYKDKWDRMIRKGGREK
jgi:hypothetical protein